MTETISVKALKKQLAAAIAMVCVPACSAGDQVTYAWFVTNNEVTAKTTSIKAQSNAAFMSIEYKASAIGSTTIAETDWFDAGDKVALFPAEVQKGEGDAPKFVTAYGTSVSDGTKKGNYTEVGDVAKAVTESLCYW